MTLQQITEPTAAANQMEDYNSSAMVGRASYSPAPGTKWAVVGLVLDDNMTTADEATLVVSIESLASVIAVANPRFYGVFPAILYINEGLETPTHEAWLHSTVRLSCITGFANNQFTLIEQRHTTIKPPLGKKWIVCNCVVSSLPTNQTEVNAFQTALEAIMGITTAKLLAWGIVPAISTNISVTVEARMRIDPISGE